MTFRLTVLGCGSSGGVPRIGGMWGQCDPQNPKNRRRRCSVLVERMGPKGTTAVLVDTSPDLREQLLSVRADHLDGVLFTHDHADHTHGIDDLRMVAYAMKRRIDCHFDPATRDSLVSRFAYCFVQLPGSDYAPILNARDIVLGQPVIIAGGGGPVDAIAVPQKHGDITSLGFRFGDIAYSPDISDMSDESAALLTGLDVWVVDALRYTAHPSHFNVKQALAWIDRLKPRRAILTHMTTDLDYNRLRGELPDGVEPAYDGLVIEG